jgi:diacylglycerol O-acyltransferase / wax synthase
MSALDAEFLHLEDGNSHMHIAGVCVFRGPAPTMDELAELVRTKLHLIPRYRQRVRPVPLDLGRPVWVDDPDFRLGYHLRHTALPTPGGTTELQALMGRLMSQPLDRNRPLWEAWLVEGVSEWDDAAGAGDPPATDGVEERWALIFKVHHCMVDGISGVGLLEVLLDLSPDVDLPRPRAWHPAPEPSLPDLVWHAWEGFAHDSRALVGRAAGLVQDPRAGVARVGELAGGLLGFARRLVVTPPSSLEGTIGPHRTYAFALAPFEQVRDIRQAFGGTVNDVVLTAVTGGYRALLDHRGDDPATAEIRSLVPVSVRRSEGMGIPDNRVSALLLDLPVELDDPAERLVEVRRRMDELKGSHMAEAGEAVTDVANITPPAVMRLVTRLGLQAQHLLTQRSITTVTTNVPGPQFPLYCLGREMVGYLPYVPISYGLRVGTAILSYNGTLSFGVTGDLDHSDDEDVQILVEGIREAMGTLHEAAGAATDRLVGGASE